MSKIETQSVNTQINGAHTMPGVVSWAWFMRRTLLCVSILGIAVISACLLYSVVNRADASGVVSAEPK